MPNPSPKTKQLKKFQASDGRGPLKHQVAIRLDDILFGVVDAQPDRAAAIREAIEEWAERRELI